MWFIGVEGKHGAPLPKKNPGSTPVMCIKNRKKN